LLSGRLESNFYSEITSTGQDVIQFPPEEIPVSQKQNAIFFLMITTLIISSCSTQTPSLSSPTLTPTTQVVSKPTPTENQDQILELFTLISRDSLFNYLEDLTLVQPYSGWRNSATAGEAEAIAYVAGILGEFEYLHKLGLELDEQSFHVYLATEIWESRLFLTLGGQESEVPTNAISGHRKVLEQSLRFDSDGLLNDADRNPLELSGSALVLQTADDVLDLSPDDAQGKIAFLNFFTIERASTFNITGGKLVSTLIQKDVGGLVLVTEEGNGKYAGDGTILEDNAQTRRIPMLYVRIEDLAPLGINSWENLTQIESARLVWDTDIFSPGTSGNLIARIPGVDSSRAIILGAHIDSANTPGAGDNGLNCVALLEMARVLNEGKIQPPVDLYLVWFGSHELGFYGSQHFVNTHQDLLDRTIAAFLMDGFTADHQGPTIFGMQEASHARFGDPQTPFIEYLIQKAGDYQISIAVFAGSNEFSSDEGPFFGFVPSVRFAFGNKRIGNNFHSPYDGLESVQDQAEVMEKTVMMSLITAIGTPSDAPGLRLTPEPNHGALIVATHTEVPHMSPTMLLDLDLALAWEGFDVDVIPYGQSPTADDLSDADLVVVLPVIDYPRTNDGSALYDEDWRDHEVELLVTYVAQGGFLVLTNSAHRLFFGDISDKNEDWGDVNSLASPFGVSYEDNTFSRSRSLVVSDHPLTENLSSLYMLFNNGLPIHLESGEALAELNGQVTLGLINYGEAGGQVLVLSDVGMLGLYDFGQRDLDNFNFLRNLARFALER
jgi:hypothetical protein